MGYQNLTHLCIRSSFCALHGGLNIIDIVVVAQSLFIHLQSTTTWSCQIFRLPCYHIFLVHLLLLIFMIRGTRSVVLILMVDGTSNGPLIVTLHLHHHTPLLALKDMQYLLDHHMDIHHQHQRNYILVLLLPMDIHRMHHHNHSPAFLSLIHHSYHHKHFLILPDIHYSHYHNHYLAFHL